MKKLLISLLFLSTLYGATDFDDAYTSYKAGEFQKALPLFKELAKKNSDNDAAYLLGYMYEHGEGVDIDKEEATKWYKLSSHGYYFDQKKNASRETVKETKKLYRSIDKNLDEETLKTIEQYSQSMYSLKAYDTNYFIPASYRADQGSYGETNGHSAKAVETEFQISVRYDYGANILGLNEVYSFAYTQHSFWQLYEKSAYFRETNYNPEAFVTIPMGYTQNFDFFKMIRFAFAHQSNGRGGAEERSWNYVEASLYFQVGPTFLNLKLWKDVGDLSYNEDLMDYMGYGSLTLLVPYKKNLFKLTSRNPFSHKGSIEGSYTYPLTQENNLFLYLKAFHGFGESLISYDKRVTKVGIGFSISR